jgi:Trk K+ transport system NAD-binding subunit
LTLVAIKREDAASGRIVTNISPAADEKINRGDVLALLGSNERLNRLDEILKQM